MEEQKKRYQYGQFTMVVKIEFDEAPLSEEENLRAERVLKELWLGLGQRPQNKDNVTVTNDVSEQSGE